MYSQRGSRPFEASLLDPLRNGRSLGCNDYVHEALWQTETKGNEWKRKRGKERYVRQGRGEGWNKEQKWQAHCQPTSHPVDPIFFKRPTHSSRPDSLTIIKRKSFYSAVSFRLCSYFLPPASASSSSWPFPPSSPSTFSRSGPLSFFLRRYCPQSRRLFYYPITLICLAKGTTIAYEGNERKTLAT